MQVLIHPGEQTYVTLGHRRGNSNLAHFALDLTGPRAKTECAAGTRAYPSPPMSGSPRLPPKQSPDAGDRGQGSFQAPSHDAYRTGSILQADDPRAHPGALAPPAGRGGRPFQLEAAAYPYRRPEEGMGRPTAYPPQPGQMISQPHYPLPPVVGPAPDTSLYSLPARPQASENPPYSTSPKAQRKTKGHVASACVPCKRAHLRCDAGRPCSRCLSNGKEDACVDVQHKKRGRPRLRDDRETRFDTGRFPNSTDPIIRRPVSLYAPVTAPAVQFDDPLRRTQSYRVLKSQPSDPIAPRFLERASAGAANIYPPPLSIPARALEPVAFLTLDFEIARVSSTFVDAIGAPMGQLVERKNLGDLLIQGDRNRMIALQRSIQDEQSRKEPNYLPPIFGRDQAERVLQSLPFDPESISKFPLDRQDCLTFIAADLQRRQYPVRIGLAKEDSIYFIVLVLMVHPRPYPQPSPSPHARELPYSYQPQPYGQLTPVSASFDPSRQRYGDPRDFREGGFTPRQPPTSHIMGMNPGVSPNMPTYSASASSRSKHPSGLSYQIPRSELSTSQPLQQPFQLPPIRSQPQQGPPIDSRAGRVDIGGLIDKPDPRRGP